MKTPFCAFALLALVLGAAPAGAAEPISRSGWSGVTLGGHDTVAYHAPGARATAGSKQFTVEWGGAVWRFASAANRDAFAADPGRYRPAYGGYCANALSLGEGLVKTDGATWALHGDRLYVFYAPRGRARWADGNWTTYRADADRAWAKITAGQ